MEAADGLAREDGDGAGRLYRLLAKTLEEIGEPARELHELSGGRDERLPETRSGRRA